MKTGEMFHIVIDGVVNGEVEIDGTRYIYAKIAGSEKTVCFQAEFVESMSKPIEQSKVIDVLYKDVDTCLKGVEKSL